MASTAAKIKYASRTTYGNNAYDLNRVRRGGAVYDVPVDIPQERPDRAPARPKSGERTKTRTRARSRASARAQAVPGVSLFAVLGFVLLAVLLVFILFANIELTEISDETVQLQDELDDLETEQASLTIKYESTFNLDEIEEYAIDVLGMTELTEENTQSLSATSEDKAEILDDSSDDGLGIFSTLTSVLSSLTEYFR